MSGAFIGRTRSGLYTNMEAMASSEVSTLSRYLAVTQAAFATGNVRAGRAVARSGGVFTKVRFASGPTITAQTFAQIGIWDSAGTKLRETLDLVANPPTPAITASTVSEATLTSPITVGAGDVYYIGMGSVHTTYNIQGTGGPVAGIAGLTPLITRVATGWAGGALPNLPAQATAGVGWFELVP